MKFFFNLFFIAQISHRIEIVCQMEVFQSFMTMMVVLRRIHVCLMMLFIFPLMILVSMWLGFMKSFSYVTAMTFWLITILPFNIWFGFLLSTFLPVITNNNLNWIRLHYRSCLRIVALIFRILALRITGNWLSYDFRLNFTLLVSYPSLCWNKRARCFLK